LLGRIEHLAGAAARRLVIPTRPGELLVMTSVGFVLCAAQDEAMVSFLAANGDPEPGTRRLIEHVLEPGGVFVDVGANLGLHTLAAAATVGAAGRVIAFEPFVETANLLRRTLAANGHADVCEVHEVALWDSDGNAPLHLGATSGHHSLVMPITRGDEGGEVLVGTRTLDGMLEAGTRVDLMKVDVEGAELKVLAGAHDVIASNPGLILIAELGAAHLAHAGVTLDEWLSAFTDLGLDWRLIDPSTGEIRVIELDDLRTIDDCNLMFARPSRLAAMIGPT
jgi:FkbM family methyltransferase